MALATRPKPKPYEKKRQAHHHRQSKHYLKAYYPYLPLFLGIVGAGIVINKLWRPSGLTGITALGQSPNISSTRLGALVGSSSSNLLLYIVLVVTFAAFAILVLSHTYRLHRVINKSEAYFIKNPWVDITLVSIVVAGVILTRA